MRWLTRLTGFGEDVWAADVVLEPDGVAIEAIYDALPGQSPYDGTAPPFMVHSVMSDFDDEIRRYGQVIADPSNPVIRLRLRASTFEAAQHIHARARALLGPGIEVVAAVGFRKDSER